MSIKTLLWMILIAIILFLGFGFYQASKLTTIEIISNTSIAAPKERVFGLVRNLKDFPKWSPFLVQDPTQQYQIKGTDGAVGAQYHWVGNKGDDVGYQELTQITEHSFIAKRCYIQKPFEAQPSFEYRFTETASGTDVTETFKLQSGITDAFFLWLFGVKNDLIKTNTQGLALLKKAAEQ